MIGTIQATKSYFQRVYNIVKLQAEDEEDISGKIIIVTGANSGIGKETTKALFQRGATVILACRNETKAIIAMDDIKKGIEMDNHNSTTAKTATGEKGQMLFLELDLADLNSGRKFVGEFKQRFTRLDILILNAGINLTRREKVKTKDGFEYHMGVNHLGHFLCTLLLLDLLKANPPSRIVLVSSFAFFYADLHLDDLQLDKAYLFPYLSLVPYGNSKLANMYFIKELTRRLVGTGVNTYCVCPGLVNGTDIMNGQSWWKKFGASLLLAVGGFTPEQGCQTTLICAMSKSIANESGKMYQFGRVWNEAMENLDEKFGLKLWDKCLELVGLENIDI